MARFPAVGETFAGYDIDEEIGRGGMSVVFRARHLALGRRAALKVLSPALASDESFRRRFIRESQLAATIDHPHVIPIYEAGEQDGVLFIAMRYVEGPDLGLLLQAQGGSLPPARAVALLDQIASALDVAHAAGLVHRDVKPANVLIAEGAGPGRRDHAYLSDFGLTKRTDSLSGVTATGSFVGTVDYVAPEQIRGEKVDGRADVYALGCMAFRCLTGSAPFERDQEYAVLFAHVETPPPSAAALRPELPAAVDAVLARAMAKAPADRYPTSGAFVADLRATLDVPGDAPEGPTAVARRRPAVPAAGGRRRRTALYAAVGVALVAVVATAVILAAGGGAEPDGRTSSSPAASPPSGKAVAVDGSCTLVAAGGAATGGDGSPARPFGTVAELLRALAADQTGCLVGRLELSRGGTVIQTPGVTLRSGTDDPATVAGSVAILADDVTIRDLRIDATDAGQPALTVGGNGFRLLRVDLTNGGTAGACLYVDDRAGHVPAGLVAVGNVIHDCGDPGDDPRNGPAVAINRAQSARLDNNYVLRAAGAAVVTYPSTHGTGITHNTMAFADAGVQFAGAPPDPTSDVLVRDNVIFGMRSFGIWSFFENGRFGSNNLAVANCIGGIEGPPIQHQGGGSKDFEAKDNVLEDPRLVDPDGDPPDLSVRNPKCSQAGVVAAGVMVDGELIVPLAATGP